MVDNGSGWIDRQNWYENLRPVLSCTPSLDRQPGQSRLLRRQQPGLRGVHAELVALLNNDAEADPGWLEALEAVIRSDGHVGMAASKILVWEDPAGSTKPAI